jgi:hypothetical protein
MMVCAGGDYLCRFGLRISYFPGSPDPGPNDAIICITKALIDSG